MSRAFSLAGLLRVRSVQEREAAQRLSRAAVEASQTQARDRHLRAALGDAGSGPQDGRTLAALAASRAAGRALLTELRVVAQLQEQTLSDARAVHDTRRREVRGWRSSRTRTCSRCARRRCGPSRRSLTR